MFVCLYICVCLVDSVSLIILLNPLCPFLTFDWHLDNFHLKQLYYYVRLPFCCFHCFLLFFIPLFPSSCLPLSYLNTILGSHLDLLAVTLWLASSCHLDVMSFFCGKSLFQALHGTKAKATAPVAQVFLGWSTHDWVQGFSSPSAWGIFDRTWCLQQWSLWMTIITKADLPDLRIDFSDLWWERDARVGRETFPQLAGWVLQI